MAGVSVHILPAWRARLAGMPSSMALGSGRVASMVIEFGTMFYLMRRLGPESFGLVAMATSLLVLLQLLRDGGAGSFIVSHRELRPEGVGAAFLVAFGISAFATMVALACTPLIAWFYHDARLVKIWIIIGLLFICSGTASVPLAIAQKQQRFFCMSWIPVLINGIAAVAAIAFSFVRADFWPLVLYHVLSSTLSLALFWLVVRPGIAWPGSGDLKEVFHFSKGVMGFELLNALNRNADDVLIGKFLGAQALGQYGFAYRALIVPLRRVGGVVNTLAFPRLSGLAPDWSAVGRGLAEVMREVALFTTPLCVGMAVAAPKLVRVAVGPAWLGAIVPFEIFALLGIFQAPFSMIGLAYLVSKKTQRMAKWSMISTPVILASFALGLPWGITGVAAAYATASGLLFWPMMKMGASALDVDPGGFVRSTLTGIGTGLLLSIPLVLAYVLTAFAGYGDTTTVVTTIAVGAFTELVLYLRVIRRRRLEGAPW